MKNNYKQIAPLVVLVGFRCVFALAFLSIRLNVNKNTTTTKKRNSSLFFFISLIILKSKTNQNKIKFAKRISINSNKYKLKSNEYVII